MTNQQDSGKILLFLDIDGVLACTGYLAGVPNESREAMFNAISAADEQMNPVAFGLLNAIFAKNENLHLVCSSVWRKKGREMVESGLREAHAALERATKVAIPYAIRWNDIEGQAESWRTAPSWEADHPRGNGVKAYLSDYDYAQTQKIILLDDSSDYHADQLPFLIRTDSHAGLTFREYILMERLLKSLAQPSIAQDHDQSDPTP